MLAVPLESHLEETSEVFLCPEPLGAPQCRQANTNRIVFSTRSYWLLRATEMLGPAVSYCRLVRALRQGAI